MNIKFSPLLIVMSVIITLMGSVKIYLISYTIMTIHEIAHLITACIIGLKPKEILFSPFGVNLKLQSKAINAFSEEIILYAVGPLTNAIMALISLYFNNLPLYYINISLFIINLIPVVPLDGGMIALRILSWKFGLNRSKRILNVISVGLGTGLLILSVISVYYNKINISMFIMSIFLIGNILTSKEKFNKDLINSVNIKKKQTNKVNFTIIDDEHGLVESLKEFTPSYTTVGIVINRAGEIKEILTEQKIIEKYHMNNLTLN